MSRILNPTTVISVRGRMADQPTLLADPKFLYVGRATYRPRVHWKRSIWASPFTAGMSRQAAIRLLGHDIDHLIRATDLDADTACRFYRAWLLGRSGLAPRLSELRGRQLGCWCCDWRPGDPNRPCHAVVLAGLANAIR